MGFCNLFSDFVERGVKRANPVADQVMQGVRGAVGLR
jgi:hypothetical protein